MKQNKILELVKGVELVAEKDDNGDYQLSINLGKRSIELKRESVEELVNWLSNEVLKLPKTPQQIFKEIENVQIEKSILPDPIRGPIVSGPLIVKPGEKIQVSDDLESRRAVVTSPTGGKDLSASTRLVTAKDELVMHNLGNEIGKAAKAFSKEHVFDGGNHQ